MGGYTACLMSVAEGIIAEQRSGAHSSSDIIVMKNGKVSCHMHPFFLFSGNASKMYSWMLSVGNLYVTLLSKETSSANQHKN